MKDEPSNASGGQVQPRKATVSDLRPNERRAAEWLLERFATGAWPTQPEFQVFCFEQDIPLEEVDANRNQVFETLHESNGPVRVGLAPWVVHGLGFKAPFQQAGRLFENAVPDLIEKRAQVTRTRAAVAEALGIQVNGLEMKYLRHVISKSRLHVLDGSNDEWSVSIPFHLLRRPLPTTEELFFPAPPPIERSSVVVDTAVIFPSGLSPRVHQPSRRPTDWVFVASTWEDLKDHREQVLWALLGQKRLPLGMEFWAPDGSRSIDRSMSELAKANLMVLILGCRYGSPARDGDDRSFIEIEYDTAKEHGIDVLPFLAHPSVAWRPETSDPQNAERLKAFRSRLERENHVYYYRSTDDLKFAVVRALDDRDERLGGQGAGSFTL